MPKASIAVCSMLIVLVMPGCAHRKDAIDQLHVTGCAPAPPSASSWHISRLYDCDSRSLFIPYQLWTGATWDGDKSKACMHKANTRFLVNGKDPTTITGPLAWTHPKSGNVHQTWHRNKVDGRKQQIFSCHELGIGRLFDSRRPRTYEPGRCKFPAGSGWQLYKRRACYETSIEIIDIRLNASNELAELEFQWWFGDTLDHVYRYAPGKSMIHAQRLSR